MVAGSSGVVETKGSKSSAEAIVSSESASSLSPQTKSGLAKNSHEVKWNSKHVGVPA